MSSSASFKLCFKRSPRPSKFAISGLALLDGLLCGIDWASVAGLARAVVAGLCDGAACCLGLCLGVLIFGCVELAPEWELGFALGLVIGLLPLEDNPSVLRTDLELGSSSSSPSSLSSSSSSLAVAT